ncbi:MAG: sigma-54-dependent transcriptional regulator [Thermoguttaceae bacterium]
MNTTRLHVQDQTVIDDRHFSTPSEKMRARYYGSDQEPVSDEVSTKSILLIGANVSYRMMMRHFLEREKYRVLDTGWGLHAVELLHSSISGVLIDVVTKDGQFEMICREIRERCPDLPILVLDEPTNDVEHRRTICRHATLYLTKPCDRQQLLNSLSFAVGNFQMIGENKKLRQLLGQPLLYDSLIGGSLIAQTLKKQIEAFGRLDNTVLIMGERGTGKNVIAQLIHSSSNRALEPFVVVSCDSVPPDVMDADLCGIVSQENGQAITERVGRLEMISHGTLVLDRIECLSSTQQERLFELLLERSFRPVGTTESRPNYTRVIATCRDSLAIACAQGRFREDLFYRLSSMTITATPLRNRPDDLPLLVQDILRRIALQKGTNQAILSQSALMKLKLHTWPGNIREQEDVLQRAVDSAKDTIVTENEIHFDPHLTIEGTMGLAGLSMMDIERRAIIETIHACNGNRAQSAQKLGISEKTIYNKIKQFKLRGIV